MPTRRTCQKFKFEYHAISKMTGASLCLYPNFLRCYENFFQIFEIIASFFHTIRQMVGRDNKTAPGDFVYLPSRFSKGQPICIIISHQLPCQHKKLVLRHLSFSHRKLELPIQWVPKLELGNQWWVEPGALRTLGPSDWLFASGAKQGIGTISSQKGEIEFIPPVFQGRI